MEGVSCHFDHTEGRHVMGQQILTLGLVTEKLFMPLDSQVYDSDSKVQGLIRAFKDKRSIVAKRFDEGLDKSKPEIAKGMLGRAKRLGINADYLIADAWFGTKPMIETALSLAVTGIFKMKKNKMKYRVVGLKNQVEALDANALYHKAVKGEWKKVRGMPYRAVTMDVELDIAPGKNKQPNVLKVRLLFGSWRDAAEQSLRREERLGTVSDHRPRNEYDKDTGDIRITLGDRSLFQRSQAAPWFSKRADVDIRLSYGVDSSHRDTLPNVGVCQTWQ